MKICSVNGCDQRMLARGWCKRHYERWKRNGDPVAPGGPRNPFTDPFIRFRRKCRLNLETGCWTWVGGKNKDGYGSFGPGGRSQTELAHRWSYANFVGKIPDGLYVLHHCDSPSCVNPDHLFIGTQKDNVADCIAKGRRAEQRTRVQAELFPEGV